MTHIRFQENDDSDYQPSDSEDDYSENEKILLENVRNRGKDDSDTENEVYGLGSEHDSDGDDKSDIALSDVEGQGDEDDIPDIRAWGKKKKDFYSTDYVDPDYGGFQGKDAALAELEEEEAKNLQKQFAQQLDDNDFSLEMFTKKVQPKNEENLEEIIKTDVSTLTKRQKLQLIKQESPEFFELIEDFKVKMKLAEEILKPILELSKTNTIKECDALSFIKFYYQLILNYCVNISVYLLLKASKVTLKSHPIIRRLFQYRQHLSKMEAVFKDVIKSQLEIVMNLEKNISNSASKKTTLKLLTKLNKKPANKNKQENIEEEPPKKKQKKDIFETSNDNDKVVKTKKVQFSNEELKLNDNNSSSDSANEAEEIGNDNIGTENISERRAITYQMAKNKGLTPHRKKEQRNPRVKHRNKFRKAKIRRKGAVREVRKELSRYGGEMSGIKASVVKSIKIKG